MKKSGLLCAALLLALSSGPFSTGLLAASQPPGSTEVGAISLPPGAAPASVRYLISESLLNRKWTVTESAGDHVVGHLVHRGYDETITFDFDSSAITVYCVGWEVDDNGNRLKPGLNDRWIANIKKDLSDRILAGALNP